MSYKVLARKWRPQKFSDMIGQEHVLRALINALDNQRLHHAYVFTGMRGVGKTTIARIFAKCLNCETNGVSANPCGECGSCKDIEAGRFFDLIEVDAASRTKVDETRELLENVPYAPASGRYKVYLIDEVHMFSTHSFNALLKTLEEPPEHVKFLLATTDPQKLPLTVLSRCLQFNLKRMPHSSLSEYLQKVLSDENIGFEAPALDIIARASEGSVRDALSLVEQAAAFGEGEVRQEEVESMLGRVSIDRLIDLLQALKQGDAEPLFEQVDALAQYAPDYSELLSEFSSIVHRVAMYHELPSRATDAKTPSEERLLNMASTIEGDELQLMYQIAAHARRDIAFAADQREAFDMALLRMLAFAPQTIDSKPAVVAGKRTATPAEKVVDKPVEETAPKPVKPAAEKPATKAEVKPVEHIKLSSINKDSWHDITSRLGISGMPRQLAEHSVLSDVAGNEVSIVLDASADHLHSPRFIERLQDALSASTGEPIKLLVSKSKGDAPLATPAKIEHKRAEDAMQAAKAAINDDPLVKQLLAETDGTVDQNSVKPLDK